MDRPMLFSGPMVRAILERRKTETRRVIIPQPEPCKCGRDREWYLDALNGLSSGCQCLRYQTPIEDGQRWLDGAEQYVRLYVREAWRVTKLYDPLPPREVVPCIGDYPHDFVQYEADDPKNWGETWGKWRRSFHMPKVFSRIKLQVTNLTVERLQAIEEAGAIAEGFEGLGCDHLGAEFGACTDCMNSGYLEPPGLHFKETWDALNSSRGYGFDANPWVRVITFEMEAA